MPQNPLLWPSITGIGIKMIRVGCTNRPFYQIGIVPRKRRSGLAPNEVIGSYDPLPNERNEKLFAVDLERLSYWIGKGAIMSQGVKMLLGMSGFMPIDHRTYATAWTSRRKQIEEVKAKDAEGRAAGGQES